MRTQGTGSLTRRSDGRWLGSLRHAGKTHRVSSMLFCEALFKFSGLPHYGTATVARSRKENLAAARNLATHTPAEWYAKKRAQNGICFYCRQKGYTKKRYLIFGRMVHRPLLVMDHMTPISRGGSDGIDNIVGACEDCNARKHAMTAEQFMALLA